MVFLTLLDLRTSDTDIANSTNRSRGYCRDSSSDRYYSLVWMSRLDREKERERKRKVKFLLISL